MLCSPLLQAGRGEERRGNEMSGLVDSLKGCEIQRGNWYLLALRHDKIWLMNMLYIYI